jgi:hypothetical protein
MSSNANPNSMANDEMKPEYDFSKAVRSEYAYRMSKLSSDEAFVLGYWQGKGFEVRKFSKQEMRQGKTPDFLLLRNGVEAAYCEVKSFLKDNWLDAQLEEAADGELVGGLRPDPIFNRISNAIHTAFRQFESVNPDHRLLNFLFLVNHDIHAKTEDFDRVFTGYEDPRHGILEATCIQYAGGRIREEKKAIDLYIWLDFELSKQMPFHWYLFFGNPDKRHEVCDLLGIDPQEIKDIQSAA